MMKAIHQLVAGFATSDAISNEARVLRAIFRSWGFDSNIFCELRCISPVLRHDGRAASQLAAVIRPGDIVILHLSIGSVVNDLFAALPCQRAMIYHNMTPATYFQGINEFISRDLAWGRKQAQALAGAAAVVMADSRYNADELAALGYGSVRVLPLLLDFNRIRTRPDRGILRTFGGDKTNILFVGRCAPNKRIEDILSAFHYFQRCVEPDSRLILVGSHTGLEKYHRLLEVMVHNLGLRQVLFTGSVSQEMLSAYYEAADLFLCMSEHEGFCIPLIESMVHDVPILAYAAAAVPETLAGAGVLFREKQWDLIAEMMDHLHRNPDLRQAVLVKQRQRLTGYETLNLEAELRNCLASMLH